MGRHEPGCAPAVKLPGGVAVGHWTDRDAWTGCTVIVGPPGSVSAGEVRGGGPGTREFALLSPATATPGAEAIVAGPQSRVVTVTGDPVELLLLAYGRMRVADVDLDGSPDDVEALLTEGRRIAGAERPSATAAS